MTPILNRRPCPDPFGIARSGSKVGPITCARRPLSRMARSHATSVSASENELSHTTLPLASIQVAVRLDEEDVARLDDMVSEGRFDSRAEAVRAAVRRMLDAEPW